jgi:HlyD family secretion protein
MSRFSHIQGAGGWLAGAGMLVALTGCNLVPEVEAQAPATREGRGGGPPAVDVAIARTGALQTPVEYTGTTRPIREVSLRAQAEGQLLNLNVDVGDAVSQGQTLAQLDDALLAGAVNQAQAERAAQQSEVVGARSRVSSARTQVEQARLALVQAQGDITRLQNSWRARIEEARLRVQQTGADAARLETLARQGAISQQQAEQARTNASQARQTLLDQQAQASQEIAQAQTEAKTAQQVLQAAQEQVQIEQQGIAAAQGQVAARQAALSQARERQSYSTLASPITGLVLERTTEPGNLVQPGSEILKLGDFGQVKVIVQISELELAGLRVGQSAQVKLDAFPDQTFSGQVSRISPAADPQARLLPVEITIPNPEGRIGSGLLARVNFAQARNQQVVVPETALQTQAERRGSQGGGQRPSGQRQDPAADPTLFVLMDRGESPRVEARSVVVGERANGQVELLRGLRPGEQFVVRSSGPLKPGGPVRLSILSETNNQGE